MVDMTTLESFVSKIKSTPEQVEFNEVIEQINQFYEYTPTAFKNGPQDDCVASAAGENEGSNKIFCFARLNDLTEQETLHCFGHYYRDDVLNNPDGSDHGNIRNFMKYGWADLSFDAVSLVAR